MTHFVNITFITTRETALQWGNTGQLVPKKINWISFSQQEIWGSSCGKCSEYCCNLFFTSGQRQKGILNALNHSNSTIAWFCKYQCCKKITILCQWLLITLPYWNRMRPLYEILDDSVSPNCLAIDNFSRAETKPEITYYRLQRTAAKGIISFGEKFLHFTIW